MHLRGVIDAVQFDYVIVGMSKSYVHRAVVDAGDVHDLVHEARVDGPLTGPNLGLPSEHRSNPFSDRFDGPGVPGKLPAHVVGPPLQSVFVAYFAQCLSYLFNRLVRRLVQEEPPVNVHSDEALSRMPPASHPFPISW